MMPEHREVAGKVRKSFFLRGTFRYRLKRLKTCSAPREQINQQTNANVLFEQTPPILPSLDLAHGPNLERTAASPPVGAG